MRFCRIQTKRASKVMLKPRRAGAEHHHAAALHDEAGNRERLLARMLEHRVDVLLLGDVPDRLAELAGLRHEGVVLGRIDLRQLPPAIEVLAVDDALGAERHHELALCFVRDDADGVGAGRRAKLHAEHAQSPRCAPDENVVARLQSMRLMAEQHAIGGCERERIATRSPPKSDVAGAPSAGGLAPGKTGRTIRRASRSPRCAARPRTSGRRRCIPHRRRRPGCNERQPRRRPSIVALLSRPPRQFRTRRSLRHDRDSCGRRARETGSPSAAQTPL